METEIFPAKSYVVDVMPMYAEEEQKPFLRIEIDYAGGGKK